MHEPTFFLVSADDRTLIPRRPSLPIPPPPPPPQIPFLLLIGSVPAWAVTYHGGCVDTFQGSCDIHMAILSNSLSYRDMIFHYNA